MLTPTEKDVLEKIADYLENHNVRAYWTGYPGAVRAIISRLSQTALTERLDEHYFPIAEADVVPEQTGAMVATCNNSLQVAAIMPNKQLLIDTFCALDRSRKSYAEWADALLDLLRPKGKG